jgi:mono/diheme cytochrome c family protein
MLFSRALLVVLSAAITSCSKPSAPKPDAVPPAPTDAESREILRESARELLDANCGECHTSGFPTALPRALAVYDLMQLDWAHSMSDTQLRDAEGRLHGPLAPTLGEAEARPMRASDAELDRFHRYVELEIGARAQRGNGHI